MSKHEVKGLLDNNEYLINSSKQILANVLNIETNDIERDYLNEYTRDTKIYLLANSIIETNRLINSKYSIDSNTIINSFVNQINNKGLSSQKFDFKDLNDIDIYINDLKKGDVIYIPSMTGHCAVSLSNSIGVSRDFIDDTNLDKYLFSCLFSSQVFEVAYRMIPYSVLQNLQNEYESIKA